MSYARAVLRLMRDTVRFGVATRRIWFSLMVVISIVIVIFVAFVQVVVPVLLYPMA